MRLGIVADIHEQVEHLQQALTNIHERSVDQVVCIGDVVLLGEHLEQTCRLLVDAGTIGVWGNHDFPYCRNTNGKLDSESSGRRATMLPTVVP